MAKFKARSFSSRGTQAGDLKVQMGKIEDNFRAVIEGLNEEAGLMTEEVAESVLERSNELVPKKTEALMKSGRVFTSQSIQGNLRAGVSYGGAGVNYAVFVHEDLAKHHPNGQAKFLEQALNELIGTPETMKVLADRLKESIS